MKYGNFVVLQMKPYEERFGCFYSVAKETWYGVFEMKPYNKGIGVKDTVEKSYKVDLIAALNSKDFFPSLSWYTDIFTCRCYKEFDYVNESFKADGFCKIQNERLKMLRDIKSNPDTHIWFKDTKGNVHQFFYNPVNEHYYEVENGEKAVDEDGSMLYASQQEMEKIMFEIDWEYNEPMKIKYNSFIKQIKHLISNIYKYIEL